MALDSSKQNHTIIGVATVAADLYRVMLIAWSVSIAAKNAMIISARAGEQARSFQPITRFIDEIARTTIDSTKKIEHESVSLTRLAAAYLRSCDAHSKFMRVKSAAKQAAGLESFVPVMQGCAASVESQSRQLIVQLRRLGEHMQELELNIQSALAVASVCRIEAARAGKFRTHFTDVANNLESAAHNIKEMVEAAQKRTFAIARENARQDLRR